MTKSLRQLEDEYYGSKRSISEWSKNSPIKNGVENPIFGMKVWSQFLNSVPMRNKKFRTIQDGEEITIETLTTKFDFVTESQADLQYNQRVMWGHRHIESLTDFILHHVNESDEFIVIAPTRYFENASVFGHGCFGNDFSTESGVYITILAVPK